MKDANEKRDTQMDCAVLIIRNLQKKSTVIVEGELKILLEKSSGCLLSSSDYQTVRINELGGSVYAIAGTKQ